MESLTKAEETILLAVWRLKDDAYGVSIQRQIKKTTNREYLYSTLYTTLEQLVRKGFLTKRYGEPTPVRGGKRKIYFEFTKAGLEALKGAYENHQSVWRGITEESFERGLV